MTNDFNYILARTGEVQIGFNYAKFFKMVRWVKGQK